YFRIGPGNVCAVDDVEFAQTAQAMLLRRNLDFPLSTAAGRAQTYDTLNGPGLPFASLALVYLGLKLDDALGAMNGGPLAGQPLGTGQQPLRWGGRLALSACLMVNALVGGAIVAVLFLVGTQLSPNRRAAVVVAVAAGVA